MDVRGRRALIWRAWCFVAGLAPGALAALAVAPAREASLHHLQIGAVGGGLLLLLGGSLLDRLPHDEPDRGATFARAASVGLLALPAVAASLLGLAPGPRWLLAVVAVALAVAFFRAARRRAPAGGAAVQAGVAAGALAGGTAAVLLLAGLLAALRAAEPPRDERLRAAVFDHDATVETLPLPSCAPRAARIRVLRAEGAHPRLAPGGALWYDAPAGGGRRQVHRVLRDTGEVTCFSCDEPGNNTYPAPSASGTTVAFETDRHATWRHPANTELHLLTVTPGPRHPASRRLTWSPGADGRPTFAPTPATLTWSHFDAGRYRVVTAGLRSAHGALQLAGATLLRDGGAEWIAPLAWSPDARTFATVRGNPLGPPRLEALDLGTGEPVPLGAHAAGTRALSFSADGGWYAVASARRAAAAGLLPGVLGFALAPALEATGNGVRFQETEVLWGPVRGETRRVELGEAAGWGWPTGLSLEPDGTGFVLGQRRAREWGVEERLVTVELDCS